MRILSLIFLIAFSANSLHVVAEIPGKKNSNTYTFGVVPQQSAKKLARLWTPILDHLSKQVGAKIIFKTARNIPVFEERLSRGEYDFAYMNPYHYTVFSEKPGYIALAKQKDKMIQGIVVVRKDSETLSLSELNGKRLAFPSPAAFAASILPQANMEKENIEFDAEYVSSHDSVYMSVARGLFAAGGGVKRTFNNISPDIRDQLRILWTTPAYTPHAIAGHPRVSPDLKAKLTKALTRVHQSEDGMAMLKSINFKPLTAPEKGDWEDVRALDIKLLNHLLDSE
jgi:phosphonate transport system substrate-binding protein